MKIVNKKLSLAEFNKYVNKKDFGSYPPTFFVLHHTWKPTKKDWAGQKTIDGLKKYYEEKGWSAGPHLFIAEDGIWLFTDMYDVGIHAGDGNGSMKDGYSIGIEVVGDYDKALWSGETLSNTVGAIRVLMKRLNLTESKIMFHRDYSTKTCPGSAITKEWVANQLKETKMEKELIKVIEDITNKDYGDNLNEKEQKEAAEKLKNKYAEAEKMLKESDKKVVEYSNTIEEQSKKIIELGEIKDKGVAAMGVIKLFQEALKQLINFK